MNLRFSKDALSLLESLKKIESITNDYKAMFNMTFEEIENSDYKHYFEPARFNTNYLKEKEKEKKRNKLQMQIDAAFWWNGYHINKEKLTSVLYDLVNLSGVYRIYNNKKELIYVGKSYKLGLRIPSSLKERKGSMFDYCVIPNKADTDIYELYYISILQPSCNEASNTGDIPTIVLPKLNFSDIIDVYTTENESIQMEERGDCTLANIIFKDVSELYDILEELRRTYYIRHVSEAKINEYEKSGTEFIVNLKLTKNS